MDFAYKNQALKLTKIIKFYWKNSSCLLFGYFNIRSLLNAILLSTQLYFCSQKLPKSRLGAVLGASWGVLEASWAVLGWSWSLLGPSWKRLRPSRSRLARLDCFHNTIPSATRWAHAAANPPPVDGRRDLPKLFLAIVLVYLAASILKSSKILFKFVL